MAACGLENWKGHCSFNKGSESEQCNYRPISLTVLSQEAMMQFHQVCILFKDELHLL